jgi:hypothetical protein
MLLRPVPLQADPARTALSFSSAAENVMWDLFKSHPNQVGSKRRVALLRNHLPDDTSGRTTTDCITYVAMVLTKAYEMVNRKVDADGIRRNLAANRARGLPLARHLVDKLGWSAHYWNPDVNHPDDGKYGEHNYTYWDAVKTRRYYSTRPWGQGGVALKGFIVNYRPATDYAVNLAYTDRKTGMRHNYATPPEFGAYNDFKQVRFAYGIARGGDHTFMCSFGYVFEVHYTAIGNNAYDFFADPTGRGDDLYSRTELPQFIWNSGIMVTPPDCTFRSAQKWSA